MIIHKYLKPTKSRMQLTETA